MNLEFLGILANPVFVLAWYGFGAAAAAWVLYDSVVVNRHVNVALKAAFPIVVVFFSPIGLALYLASCRPPGVGRLPDDEAKHRHTAFVSARWKKVIGSDIHCVSGDGLGIVSAMIVTRWLGLSFWSEFWIEYAVGFAFGWLIFQYLGMRSMGEPPLVALWKGGRAEFFSMMTVMVGMGLVMAFVTPTVVGHRPTPNEAAFWGFAALGLLAGFLLTYPMNWWLVAIGWKHGMG